MAERKQRSLKERFEEKFLITPGCWIWQTGVMGNNKYGCFNHASKNLAAHRFSYELYVGPIPEGLHVLHKCDRPTCVNPDHLFLGTHQDNVRDMVSKGRHKLPPFRIPPKGEQQWAAKLTAPQVLAIRADQRRYKHIAEEYGVSKDLISSIRTRRLWRHI